MLAHARFAKSFRAHLGQNTATATTQARILPERFHGPDEPHACKEGIDLNRCLLRQTRFLSSALKRGAPRQATTPHSFWASGFYSSSRCLSAAATKPLNSGWGLVGRLLNSGWAWLATNHGWFGSSIISVRRPSGETPEITMPASWSLPRYSLFTS